MNDGHFTTALSRHWYRLKLARRRLTPHRQSNAFGLPRDARIGRVYVINLDRQTGRWSGMHKELARIRDAQGKPLEHLVKRVSAIDARYNVEPAPHRVDARYTLADQLFVDPRHLPDTIGDPSDISIEMSAEEVAVALSHVKTWELIAEGSHDYALVLEDDVYFDRKFHGTLDSAWRELAAAERPDAFDLLFLSYEEALSGAAWAHVGKTTRQPVRGLWQLSGYVLSRSGARNLLDRLPVKGPVDLWIKHTFDALKVRAVHRPIIGQRLDIPSSNFYSALPVLSKVGLISAERPSSIERRSVTGPVFGLGGPGSGVTALATAISMLGFRCCSDLEQLPDNEHQSLLGGSADRVFDAYVNIGSLDEPALHKRAEIHSESRIVVAAATADAANVGMLQDLAHSAKVLILPADHPDRWRLLTEFLGCDYPSHRFPRSADYPRRAIMAASAQQAERQNSTTVLEWDSLPWIVDSNTWPGIRLAMSASPDSEGPATPFEMKEDDHWLFRNDTFPGNLALFDPRNFLRTDSEVARLSLRRAATSVREFTSAAISSRSLYRHGRFVAEVMPAKVSGVVTGVFLHRNSPRQEIDIEFVGNDTTKMLVNVYFNPGEEGTRMEHGYRGTPVAIELGFDASVAFHRYEINWTPERINWLVDGECVYERAHWHPTPVPHLPMQFHVNLWHSNSAALAGPLDEDGLPASTYVRNVSITAARALPASSPGTSRSALD